jgi:hypothetical protein
MMESCGRNNIPFVGIVYRRKRTLDGIVNMPYI